MMSVSVSTSSLIFMIFSAVLVVLLSTSSAIADDDDGVYMSKLLNALTPTPTGWSHDTNFCTWVGIGCNDQSGRVTHINLPSRLIRLKGTIPSDLNSLSDLTYLNLASNSLTGPLPSLANLTKLETVYLDFNTFTSVPHGCFQGLTYLKILSLRGNKNLAPWTFPTDLARSSLLETLYLDSTNIIGSLPAAIFDWFPILKSLSLSHNNITGVLPLSLGRSPIWYLSLD